MVLSLFNSCSKPEAFTEEGYHYKTFEKNVFDQLTSAGIDTLTVAKTLIGLDSYYYYPIKSNPSAKSQEHGNIFQKNTKSQDQHGL